MDMVVLVDSDNRELGQMEKLEAHQKGLLHRAFSILIYNSKGELLLQKRADHKYHSAGLWTNACCSHPAPGEELTDAASRRLKEELGLVKIPLTLENSFIYRAEFGNGLTEHELDFIFKGNCDDDPVLNKEEASEYRWISRVELENEVGEHPGRFTFWFREMLKRELL